MGKGRKSALGGWKLLKDTCYNVVAGARSIDYFPYFHSMWSDLGVSAFIHIINVVGRQKNTC